MTRQEIETTYKVENGRIRSPGQAATDHSAFGHPAYSSSLQNAARQAFDNRGQCYSVYYDGEKIYVRHSKEPKPDNSKCVCIAQYWGNNKTADGRDLHTVQLRFDGAGSEWVHF